MHFILQADLYTQISLLGNNTVSQNVKKFGNEYPEYLNTYLRYD